MSGRAQQANPPGDQQPLAIFNGQPIVDEQLPPGEQAQLQRMMQQVYAVKLRGLHEVLDRRLFEAEAKRKGVSLDELVDTEVVSKVPVPSDEEVEAYYKQHQANFKEPYDQLKEKIRTGMRNLEIQKQQLAYAQNLLVEAVNTGQLQLLLRPPRVEVNPDPSRLRGDANAPVTIVEFSDFSCTFCRSAEGTIGELLAKYPGKVKVGYRDFPLRQLHPNAEMAAEASRCAGEQGKYWEYHDLLFANYNKQSHDELMAYARDMKLDEKAFDACLMSGRFKPQIEQDIALGTRSGVVATPGFFVNGRFLSGAQPPAVFEQIIEQELLNGPPKTPKQPAHTTAEQAPTASGR